MRGFIPIPPVSRSSRFARFCLGALAAGLVDLALPVSARAQDVSSSPFQWTSPKDPPDELPGFKHAPRVEFPAELRSTTDVGYVELEIILDSKARPLSAIRHASLGAYARACTLVNWTFTPGRRAGNPVNTSVYFAFLFNPRSAALEGPDATPRLLDVAVVRVPRPRGAPRDRIFDDQVVFATVAVDESGRVSQVKDAPPELAEKFAIAAKLWRFAPARKDGKPVASEIRAPFVVVTAGSQRLTGKNVPARATFQTKPIYPFALRASGMRGEVLVDFIVDIEGRVRNARVVRTLNPAFDDPALDAVRKWRFEPARRGETPVNARMQVPIVFRLDNQPDGGRDGIEIRHKPDLSKLPEELRYDTPPRLIGLVRPVFPYAQLQARKEGNAVVQYLIGETGRVVEARVTKATAPEFGQALLAAVEQFVYEPALKKGRPCMALMSFEQEFSTDEGYQIVADEDLDLLARERKKPQTFVSAAELDRHLRALSRPPAHFPLSHAADAMRGKAVIEFVIDEDGRPRLPRIVSATDDSFGYAAVQGIAGWRFEPPTRGGRPVVTRVRVPLDFTPASKPPAPVPSAP